MRVATMAKIPQETVLSFFTTVSRKDFTNLYRLPQEFMENHGSDFPRKVKLRIESGRTWDVKVETMDGDDGLFCFKTGWDVFAKEIDLKFTEFLIFTLDNSDGYTVDVSHYDSNGCIKTTDQLTDDDDDEEENNEDDEDDMDDDDEAADIEEDKDDSDDDGATRKMRFREDNPLYYETVLNKNNRYRLTLKRQFVRASGLSGKNSVVVVGKYHKLSVGLDNTHKDKNRIDLTSQWFEFQQINGIVSGKKYSFEFKPDTGTIHINELV